jgi:2-oxoglutarate dehydrogenase E2 component (dihydrolipoamide succinyltransferase)
MSPRMSDNVEVRVPVLGESVVEATVGSWLKREGESVQAGEPLVQLETDKVNVDVSADTSGVLASIAHREGDTVVPGDVLATIGSATTETSVVDVPSSQPTAAAAPNETAASPEPESNGDRPHASPVARRMAEEHGVDLRTVEGTGTGGRVTREDVERHLTPHTPSLATPPAERTPDGQPAPASTRGERRTRMSRRRQTIAQRLLEAQRTAAMLTTFNEVDMSAVIAIRSRRREAFQARHKVGLGFMSFFVKAVVAALKAFPLMNAEIRGDEIVEKDYYDIGVAVGAEGGLVVPVVRDADRLSFAEIEKTIAALAERARNGTLTLEDLRGGTFTITNGGVFGSLLSTPILSPPQVGILGMHKIEQRPVAIDGQVVIRPMMYLAVTYDHRLVDGREAVQFLVRIKELIEDPTNLLLDL